MVIAGDIFDRARPEIIDLYRQRYERGEGEKRIHFPVYPGLGNHDLDTAKDGAPNNERHLQLIKKLSGFSSGGSFRERGDTEPASFQPELFMEHGRCAFRACATLRRGYFLLRE